MPRVDTKWKEYKGEKLVALKEPRQVSRVGYKIHRGLAKFHFLKEMDDRIAFGPEDETPDIDPYRIVGSHPKMVPYLGGRDTIREVLTNTLSQAGVRDAFELSRAIDEILDRLDKSVIREMVEQIYNKLKAEEKDPPRREIYFSPLAQGDSMFLPSNNHDPDWWRGPWEVSGWRRVYSGMYDRGYSCRGYDGDGDDYEPAGLRNRKAHILLRVRKVNERHIGYSKFIMLLKEDTYPWDCEKWARIFAEAK